MDDKDFRKLYIRMIVLFLLAMLASKFTSGLFAFALVALGLCYGLAGKMGHLFSIYVLISFMMMLGGQVVGRSYQFGIACRINVIVSTFLLIVRGAVGSGRDKIPIGLIFLYLLSAIPGSVTGYWPKVSYLKLVNFAVFVLGIYLGSRLISKTPKDFYLVRASMLALATILIFGSAISFFFPSIGYMSGASLAEQGYSEAEIAQQLASSTSLFCGITGHSQTMASFMVLTLGWVICDMLYVERRVTKLHGALAIVGIPMLFMTRSRTGLLCFVVFSTLVFTFCLPKIQLPRKVKSIVRNTVYAGLVVIAVAAMIGEARNNMMTRWLRKTDDIAGDQRSFGEAFTSSRMGLVEQNMHDFRRNPAIGSGFQVADGMAERFGNPEGLVISATIEKGVLPLMVLGEAGIIGGVCFALFLFTFYSGCASRKYYVTMTLFTVLLTQNMSEANFFSPNGGGYEWFVASLGGFAIDVFVRKRNQQEMGMIPMNNAMRRF